MPHRNKVIEDRESQWQDILKDVITKEAVIEYINHCPLKIPQDIISQNYMSVTCNI